MRDGAIWSVNLGRAAGVRIRLHAFFLLFALATLFLGAGGDRELLGYGAMALGVLLASVVVHELAHGVAAQRVGGHVEEVLLGPLGGLSQPELPKQPQLQLIVAVAGPLANLGLVLASGIGLFIVGREQDVAPLLNVFAPERVLVGAIWLVALKLVFWVNWLLVVANLLPAMPFDAGLALRAALWPFVGYRQAVRIVALVAKITAVALCVGAWFLPQAMLVHDRATVPIPLWLPVVMIALVLFFSAKAEVERLHERELSEDWLGFDVSQQYADDDEPIEPRRHDPGVIERWLQRRRAARLRRQQLEEEEEEWRVDDILARLHQSGMKSLTPEDRAILHRVSQRYRNRQSH